MGDWMPLASPTCKIRSNAAGNGLHKEKNEKQPMLKACSSNNIKLVM
jgi:hypothetical protein